MSFGFGRLYSVLRLSPHILCRSPLSLTSNFSGVLGSHARRGDEIGIICSPHIVASRSGCSVLTRTLDRRNPRYLLMRWVGPGMPLTVPDIWQANCSAGEVKHSKLLTSWRMSMAA